MQTKSDGPHLAPNTTKQDSAALLSEREAASFLGIAPRTLSIWRSTKRYPLPFVKVGRAVRYRREELERFIAARTVAGGGE